MLVVMGVGINGVGTGIRRLKSAGFAEVLIQSAVLTDWPNGTVAPSTVTPAPTPPICKRLRREIDAMTIPLEAHPPRAHDFDPEGGVAPLGLPWVPDPAPLVPAPCSRRADVVTAAVTPSPIRFRVADLTP